ncbi:hypothetical protein TRL7639_04196 [Falsiruegeria litorea R37]|uniref:RiboL-PSP-HEPN domain-containing protein n=2 Tax=Falsiruegeria litorea TaxID=1280831 RepID=A0A1Y5TSC1_9RHOB|nr:hypothetical protein TRL7639_04196 [Falsiruegeria litorea R37]
MLDAVFKQCDPDFFTPKLKHIHNSKYGIEDLIDIYKRRIHPLELVSSDVSFQNVDKVDKVFSKFLGKSIWKAVFDLKVRIKDKPECVVCFEPELLNALERTFSLRHELVHNPRADFKLKENQLKDIRNADGLLFATDIILGNMIAENIDPELRISTE